MTKTLTILIVLFTLTSSYGQNWTKLASKIRLITDTPTYTKDSTGLYRLHKPEYKCLEGEGESPWHVSDLNNDGLEDLIYSGPCNPYYQTAIFLNSVNGLTLLHDYAGILISIKKKKDETNIYILKSSYGCDYYSELIEIILLRNNNKFKKHTLSFHIETTVTQATNYNKKKLSGIVRTAPVINDVLTEDKCTGEMIRGNQIDILKNESSIRINSHNSWDLVLYKKGEERTNIGWIKHEK